MSSVAVPVTVKVVGGTIPDGPVIDARRGRVLDAERLELLARLGCIVGAVGRVGSRLDPQHPVLDDGQRQRPDPSRWRRGSRG